MASDTKNVKLGVCRIMYKGNDLGYTKGGVEVEVTTSTHPVTVDQFGETTINEYITKRDVKVKVPLAETTIENLAATMPGTTLFSDGVRASGTITVSALPVANDTLTVNGAVFTFKASVASAYDILIGADAAATAANVAEALTASTNAKVVQAQYSLAGAVVTVKFDVDGVAGNSFTLAKTGTGITLSGAKLTGGTDTLKKRADVTSGIGINLLSISGELALHPIALPETDLSEDFVIPKAGTAGAMKYSYKHDQERIYDVEFMGYPDPNTGLLFSLGDKSVTTALA